jgi:hypothetical protein
MGPEAVVISRPGTEELLGLISNEQTEALLVLDVTETALAPNFALGLFLGALDADPSTSFESPGYVSSLRGRRAWLETWAGPRGEPDHAIPFLSVAWPAISLQGEPGGEDRTPVKNPAARLTARRRLMLQSECSVEQCPHR